MDVVELIGGIIGAICFLVWAPSLISWLRHGVAIPTYIHVLAIVLTAVVGSLAVGLGWSKSITWVAALGFATAPFVMTYLGWFWLFGPEFHERDKR